MVEMVELFPWCALDLVPRLPNTVRHVNLDDHTVKYQRCRQSSFMSTAAPLVLELCGLTGPA